MKEMQLDQIEDHPHCNVKAVIPIANSSKFLLDFGTYNWVC